MGKSLEQIISQDNVIILGKCLHRKSKGTQPNYMWCLYFETEGQEVVSLFINIFEHLTWPEEKAYSRTLENCVEKFSDVSIMDGRSTTIDKNKTRSHKLSAKILMSYSCPATAFSL